MKTRVCLALCAATIAIPAYAQTESHLSADVSSSLGYSNNPFSTTGSDTGAGFVQVDIRPQLRLLRQNSALTISVDANVQQYFNRYARSDSYSGGLNYSFVPAEHVQGHLSASASSSVVGSSNDLSNQFNIVRPLDPVGTPGTGIGAGSGTVITNPISTIPVNAGTDIALFGTRARRRTLNAGGDVSASLSARDSVNASAFVIDSRYSGGRAADTNIGLFGSTGDYTGYGGTVGYSRQIAEYLQAGLQGSGSRYDYSSLGGDTNVYSVQATASARVNTYWSINGALGVSFVQRELNGSQTSLSGNLSVCRRGIRSAYCLTANRAVLPTGSLGTQITTSVGGSYSYRLTEHSNISAGADYDRNSVPRVLLGTGNALGIGNEYLRTTLNYDRQLRQRLRMTTSVNYRKIFGSNLNRPSDFGGQIGLALSLGDNR